MKTTPTPETHLPIPFFQVLEEEDGAINSPGSLRESSWERTLSNEKNWLFDKTHLSDSLLELEPTDQKLAFREFAKRLRCVLQQKPDEKAAAGAQIDEREAVDEDTLIALLNSLLVASKSVYWMPNFPREKLKSELVELAHIKLNPNEHLLANRLLLEGVFPDELRRIYDIRLSHVYERIHSRAKEGNSKKPMLRSALCLSGGGIRSATFALGILQGLARRDLLDKFDYLSTVSGGGYIGGWLSSWIHHAKDASKVFRELRCERSESPTTPEPVPVTHLRMFSNYLTPKLGMFSVDTWTLIGTYLRNLFVNWLVCVPFLMAIIAIPWVYVSVLQSPPPQWLLQALLYVGAIGCACALTYAMINRPGAAPTGPPNSFWSARRKQGSFLRWCLLPLTTSAICFTTSWSWLHDYPLDLRSPQISGFTFYPAQPIFFVSFGLFLHLAAWVSSELCLGAFRKRLGVSSLVTGAVVLVTGALGGFFAWCLAHFASSPFGGDQRWALVACFAVPLFLSLFLITASIFIGLVSRKTSDEDREWWARMGGWILIVILAWVLFNGLVVFGHRILVQWTWTWIRGAVVAAGGIMGLASLVLAHYTKAPAKASDGSSSTWTKILLCVSAPVLLTYIVVGLSTLTYWIIYTLAHFDPTLVSLPNFDEYFEALNQSLLIWSFALALALLGFGMMLSLLININKFSIHAIYRDRLVRAYLGASNPKRNPNPFTGFDPEDNLHLRHLRNPGNPELPQRPIQIINMALNVVAGDNLAWQQRKAETFTASTLHCGNFRLGFRPTGTYAQNETKLGLTLGSAVAISGAAASPNQGYHSSPLIAMLMTFFNVRLGWWLGNPGIAGHATFRLPAPRSPVRHFVKEGLGMTDSASPYVYLSDGGHFENLGLYEMILRRCHQIVISDAGCDPKCSLEDLGNAIRKIQIDLGVKIDIKEFFIRSRNTEEKDIVGKYCAVGHIDYTGVDGEGAQPGTLLYFKPAICGKEPRDVFNYKEGHKEFPHESTGDQWFTESQFESYRKLGLYMIEQLPDRVNPSGLNSLSDFIECARAYINAKAGEAAMPSQTPCAKSPT